MNQDISAAAFETTSTRMEPFWLVSVQVDQGDATSIVDRLTQVVPLTMGHYDRCVFRSAPGIDCYRPRTGAKAGAESETRERPGVIEISFQLPKDQDLLALAIEAIVGVHSYEEPVILVRDVLASRSKGLDPTNPNRWWNKDNVQVRTL